MLAHWLALVLAQLNPAPAATLPVIPTPQPTGPVYVGQPAAKLTLESRPLGVDPDGDFRWLVIARYLDPQGSPTRIMLNSDLDWMPDRGAMQWQARMHYGQPAAIVRLNDLRAVRMRVRSNKPKLADAYASMDPAQWRGPRVVAAALGPHMIQIGWFPRAMRPVRIERWDGNHRTTFAAFPPSQTYRDDTVAPARTYRYVVYRAGQPPAHLPPAHTPPEAPHVDISAASGKAMWLYFGTNPYDNHYLGTWNPQTFVDQAVQAGLHYIELRTAYGAYWEVDPQNKHIIDAIIDGLAAHGIGTIGWTVPRQASFEDLSVSVKTAYYRTAKGTPVTGLALDLERGDEFMHDCPEGCKAMGDYVRRLRQALGPNYKIVATIEDPFLEHLDNSKYPYTTIAKYVDVLQPMAYWRMMSRNSMDVAKMNGLLKGSFEKTLQVSGRTLPISIGGQTSPEGRLGNPPPDEVYASLVQAKALGAIGECFFDWDGTLPDQWDAIARYSW